MSRIPAQRSMMALLLSMVASATAASPGIFWANSGVRPDFKNVLSYEDYSKWYETYHIPDWMGAKAGAITSAWRYQSLDPDREAPFLVTYKYPDIAATSAPEFRNVTLNHPSLPEGGPISKFAQFVVESGPHIETWKSGATGDARGPLLVVEAIELAGNTTAAFNQWYRSTYITELSLRQGWRRTSRFDTASRGNGSPRFLTLHEFEESAFPPGTTKIPSLLGQSAATADIQKSAKKAELSLWKLSRVYGDGNVAWGNPGEDKIL